MKSEIYLFFPLFISTQLTVVVKYFSQFGFFPWTTSAYRGINAERAFAVPNIVGIEKKDGYVLLDLIQLIALFFHRSILKVLPMLHPPRNLHKIFNCHWKLSLDIRYLTVFFLSTQITTSFSRNALN